jgi:hypothetical protein
MFDGSSLIMFDECVILSWNRNITCFLCFINFGSEFGCGLCPKLGWKVWSLGRKLGIDHMCEFRGKKYQNNLVFVGDFQCQNDLVFSLMIFSVKMT